MTARFQLRRPIPRFKRSDLIVEEIKRWIVSQSLKPGDRLPREHELIKLFSSSRGTVREALKVLESQGLIEISPGARGGARIASVSQERTSQFLRNFLYFQPLSWAQIYAVREKLEPMLAVSAADHLTKEDIAALRATIDICRMGIAGEIEPREHRAAELEFHAILCRACPEPMLRFLCSFITDLLRDFSEYRNVIEPRDSAFAKAALHYHRALVEAYEQRDQQRVGTIMAEHIHDAACIVSEKETQFDGGFLLSANG